LERNEDGEVAIAINTDDNNHAPSKTTSIEMMSSNNVLQQRRKSLSLSTVSSSSSASSYGSGPLLQLFEELNEPGMTLTSDTEDIFTLDTFHAMIQSRIRGAISLQRSIRPLIIARVTTRDKQCTQKLNIHFYEATNLLKVLFKLIDDRILHRYHRYDAILPTNPLTNTVILGEVRFYSIDYSNIQPLLSSASTSTSSSSQLSSFTPSKYVARFIGTDYNYAYSEEFRALFTTALMDMNVEDVNLAKINQALLASEIPRPGSQAGNPNEQIIFLPPSQAPLIPCCRIFPQNRPIIPIPFARSVIFGSLLSFYIALTILLMTTSIHALRTSDNSTSANSSGRITTILEFISSTWYCLFLPFISFFFDQSLSVLYSQSLHKGILSFKILLYMLYFILPILSFTSHFASIAIGLRYIPLIVLPIVYLLLSSLIWFKNAFQIELM
jgi:hypothetical protein